MEVVKLITRHKLILQTGMGTGVTLTASKAYLCFYSMMSKGEILLILVGLLIHCSAIPNSPSPSPPSHKHFVSFMSTICRVAKKVKFYCKAYNFAIYY